MVKVCKKAFVLEQIFYLENMLSFMWYSLQSGTYIFFVKDNYYI